MCTAIDNVLSKYVKFINNLQFLSFDCDDGRIPGSGIVSVFEVQIIKAYLSQAYEIRAFNFY